MSDSNRLLARFDKNSVEEIQVNAVQWKTQTYIDLRTWFRAEAGEGAAIHPTTKGIRFNAELLRDLISALEKAQSELENGPEVEVIQDDGREAGGSCG